MEFDTEQLITEVRAHPELWDTSTGEYRDRKNHKAAWMEICSHMFPTWNSESDQNKQALMKSLAEKWRKIRDAFTRSRKNLRSGSSARTRKKYVYADLLSFLVPRLQYRESLSTGINSQVNKNDNSSSEGAEEIDDQKFLPQTSDINTSTQSSTSLSSPPNKKRSLKDMKKSAPQLESKISDNLSIAKARLTDQNTPDEENDDLYFFKSLIPALKEIPLHKKIQFRMNVLSALHQILSPHPYSTSHQNPVHSMPSPTFTPEADVLVHSPASP